MAVRVPPDGLPYTLSLQVRPYVSKNIRRQRMEVIVDGAPALHRELSRNKAYTIEITLEANDGREAIVRFVDLVLPDAASPKAAGESEDARVLALRVTSLLMREGRGDATPARFGWPLRFWRRPDVR